MIFVTSALVPLSASAHVTAATTGRTTWRSWRLDPLVAISLIVIGWLYARGVAALWRRAGHGRGIPAWRVWAFGGGLLSVLVALASPIDDASNQLLAAHMGQHMILIFISAPLLALGAPLAPVTIALPEEWRPRVSQVTRVVSRSALHWLANPLMAALVQALVFWLWHLPGPYEAALRHDSLHALEHLSMLLSAALFWWAVIPKMGRRSQNLGVAVLAVVLAGMQSGVLGALLTFSGTAWYPAYAAREGLWHLTPGDDQQLAGLVMWIPGGLVHLFAALALLGIWLQADERHADRRRVALSLVHAKGEG